MIPKLEKCTKYTKNLPNGHKISQISVKYSKWPNNRHFPIKGPQKFAQIGIFGLKTNHLATLFGRCLRLFHKPMKIVFVSTSRRCSQA
jgi:hypothetical protein